MLLVGALATLAVAALVWTSGRAPAATEAAPAPTLAALAGPVGAVDGCRAGPRFQEQLSLSAQAALTTSLTNIKGLAILDPAGDGGQGAIYRHDTWDDAGFLGPFITDRRGDIFVAPAPLVSLIDNPPELQNRIYRVDGNDEAMALFVELEPAQPISGANPFGVVGLAYDCETESLYATSLAGSTAGQEVGRIFQISLNTGEVLSQLDGVDAMGVAAYNTPQGKRLYFGLARSPEVRSVALDAEGRITGEPRAEFSYGGETLGGRRTARRIRFGDDGEMRLSMTDFNFSLQIASKRLEDVITFRYDADADQWTFERIDPAQ